MKKIFIAYTTEEFEKFVNRDDIEVIQVDIKVVESSYMFQQGFAGVVYYNAKDESNPLTQ